MNNEIFNYVYKCLPNSSKLLHVTEVGSFMWNMGNECETNGRLSDHDMFIVYQQPTAKILMGRDHLKNFPCKHNISLNRNIYDFTFMEVEHFLNSIIKGNINAVMGLTSPLVYYPFCFDKVRYYVMDNIKEFNIIPSVLGMCRHQLKDIQESTTSINSKKLGISYRLLKFAENVYENNTLNYSKINKEDATLLNCNQLIKKLQCINIKQNSTIDNVIRSYLLEIRLNDLESNSWCPLDNEE